MAGYLGAAVTTCPHCKRSFKNDQGARIHCSTMHGGRPYPFKHLSKRKDAPTWARWRRA